MLSAKWLGVLAASVMLIGGCTTDPDVRAQKQLEKRMKRAERAIEKAVFNRNRPEADLTDDAARKPYDVLVFSGIEPGMTVLEMEAGSGYYTEIMSRVVGEDGKIYLQNPAEFDAFLGDSLTVRLAENRLPNVQVVRSKFDDLSAVPSRSVDLVTWILGPHELYFKTPPNGGDGELDFGETEATFLEINRVLKPGGLFFALDHEAKIGAPESVGDTLHRIDPGLVQIEAEKAGLAYIAKSDALKNPADDLTKNVFDPSIRRQTSRFMLKFQKQG